jgi:beta-N-acetylhexosaminidase
MPIGPLMIDLVETRLTQEEKDFLKHPFVGGVILLTRNFQSMGQLQDLIYEIRSQRHHPLLIAIHQEGGRVQRFCDGFTPLPSCTQYGGYYDRDPEKALDLTELGGWLMASELLSVGIDMSLSPVLDLNSGVSSVMRDRCFHHDPEIVGKLASAFTRGMHKAGMATTGKHYPGHGSVKGDARMKFPIDKREFLEIVENDLLPFIRLIQEDLNAIMPAHIIYQQMDDKPASFSKFWLQYILRDQFKFTGAIISDDLSMAGAAYLGGYTERVQKALEAGCDMLIICNNPMAIQEVLETYSPSLISPCSKQRLLKLCGRFRYTRAELYSSEAWEAANAAIEAFGDLKI